MESPRPPKSVPRSAPKLRRSESPAKARPSLEIVILAGGLSRRMGRDKASMRLGRASILTHVRRAAGRVGVPVRILRHDRVPRCGPLGGVYTALRATCHTAVMFLACDTPFLPPEIPDRVRRSLRTNDRAVFTEDQEGRLGMPFLLRKETLNEVAALLETGDFSLRSLAVRLGARRWKVPAALADGLFNVNTPADWEEARRRWRDGQRAAGATPLRPRSRRVAGPVTPPAIHPAPGPPRR